MPVTTPGKDDADIECLDPGAVAAQLKCGRRAACRIMREAGGFRFGDSWRIRASQLRAWMATQEARDIRVLIAQDTVRRNPSPHSKRAAEARAFLESIGLSSPRPPLIIPQPWGRKPKPTDETGAQADARPRARAIFPRTKRKPPL